MELAAFSGCAEKIKNSDALLLARFARELCGISSNFKRAKYQNEKPSPNNLLGEGWEPLFNFQPAYLQCLLSLKSRNHQPSSHSKVTFRQPSGTWG